MIDDFWNELNEGDIHVRDNLQFELKSEFSINPQLKRNIYNQEVYFFIPNPLQVNSKTYSKPQFYLDQTNLIRYKTPSMSLSEIYNLDFPPSPLARIHRLLKENSLDSTLSVASDELKLFAAIFRSAVRERIYKIVQMLGSTHPTDPIQQQIDSLCSEISETTHKFRQIQENAHKNEHYPQLIRHFKYVDEFISTTICEFLVVLLKQYRSLEEQAQSSDKLLTQMIIKETLYRKKHHLGPKTVKGQTLANEAILHRQGLLHRFVLESLILKHRRYSPEEKHRSLLSAFAAGFAMLIYMIIFVWQISPLVNNAFPFVTLAVLFYILKDRLKEGFKTLFARHSHRWFPDYSTEITSFKGYTVGRLEESSAFITPEQLPEEFSHIRNYAFHEELQALPRHETIIQYKRELILTSPSTTSTGRRSEITTIFRFNVHRFLQKASNPFQTNLTLDTYTQEILERLLPKVYHLNLIIRNTLLQENQEKKIEIKTFRVVIDKNGIKRVEQTKRVIS